MNRTLIIAEAGVNHNGDINLAKELIDIAADCGADIVKFQSFNADRLATPGAEKAGYQIKGDSVVESQHEMLKKLELSEKAHQELMNHCESKKIKFLSTGFDTDSLKMLVGLGQNLIKIPSGEITNLPFLRYIGGLNKNVIMSTGMSDLKEIGSALKILETSGTSLSKISVLHCSTAYPTEMSEVNLRAMLTIRDKFGVTVGYSDHTSGIEVSIAAVAMGASIVEKHFTKDKNLLGPDHKASLEPSELKQMIKSIRNIEIALGDGIKRIMPGEVSNLLVIRKSIVASKKIKKGELFSDSNLTSKRPGTGISAMEWDRFVGERATRDYAENEFIE
jgi:N,N'-diacetyllegionaminate synthase